MECEEPGLSLLDGGMVKLLDALVEPSRLSMEDLGV
jgi:hypothetical protein